MADVLQPCWFAQPAAGVGPQQGWLRFHWWLKELAGKRYRMRDRGSWRGGRRWRQGTRRGLDNAVICCFCANSFCDRRTTSSAAIGPLLVQIDGLTNKISSSGSWVIGACYPPAPCWGNKILPHPRQLRTTSSAFAPCIPNNTSQILTSTCLVALDIQGGVGNSKVQPILLFSSTFRHCTFLGNFGSLKISLAVRRNP